MYRCSLLYFSLQVYSVLSYSSVHSLHQSGSSMVDSAHLHLLHLVTVAHLVQILLTSTTGEIHTWRTQQIHTCTHDVLQVVPHEAVCFYLSLTCLCVEEVCMDQDSGGSEEEELTCQLYDTLRKHLGGWAHSNTHTHWDRSPVRWSTVLNIS